MHIVHPRLLQLLIQRLRAHALEGRLLEDVAERVQQPRELLGGERRREEALQLLLLVRGEEALVLLTHTHTHTCTQNKARGQRYSAAVQGDAVSE
jgi:hypothetical protein